MQLDEMREDYDWKSALEIAGKPSGIIGYKGSLEFNSWSDIQKLIASDSGANDGANWIAIFRLSGGRHAFLCAGCDYTGWDCQAGGSIQIARTLKDLIRFGLSMDDRARLGYKLDDE